MRTLPEILKTAALALAEVGAPAEEQDALEALAQSIGARGAPPGGGQALTPVEGDDSPYGEHNTVVDASRALLPESTDVAMSDQSDGRRIAVMDIAGRINRSEERTRVVVLLNPDGVAAIVTQLIGLMQRDRSPFAREFQAAFTERMADLP